MLSTSQLSALKYATDGVYPQYCYVERFQLYDSIVEYMYLTCASIKFHSENCRRTELQLLDLACLSSCYTKIAASRVEQTFHWTDETIFPCSVLVKRATLINRLRFVSS